MNFFHNFAQYNWRNRRRRKRRKNKEKCTAVTCEVEINFRYYKLIKTRQIDHFYGWSRYSFVRPIASKPLFYLNCLFREMWGVSIHFVMNRITLFIDCFHFIRENSSHLPSDFQTEYRHLLDKLSYHESSW